jgi:HEAT repeat protein
VSLADLLRDPEDSVRSAAAWAVGGLGPAAVTPATLGPLVDLLRDPEDSVRGEAEGAIEDLIQAGHRFFDQPTGGWTARHVNDLSR